MQPMQENIVVIISVAIFLAIFFSKKFRQSKDWRATVTPLASIIGSGFLISAPLLILTAGEWAFFVMGIIVLIAYGLGSALRFNIWHLEPLLKQPSRGEKVVKLETLSRPLLGFAYIISVAFYLKLLSAFALRGVGLSNDLYENILTTIILIFIGGVGKLRGLVALEWLEKCSVNLKLAIFLSMIIGHLFFNIELARQGEWLLKVYPHDSFVIATKKLLGVLLIVQGFETSRYLGQVYDQATRVRTMRYAQIFSGAIYLAFIGLAIVLFNDIHQIDETTVIDLCALVAPVLPALLIIAALMSQFSAAIADTLGSGGLLSEATKQKLTLRNSFLVLTGIAIVLTWTTNIFQIITLASKGFALYYAIQCYIAMTLALKQRTDRLRHFRSGFFGFFVILMLLVVVFSIPIE